MKEAIFAAAFTSLLVNTVWHSVSSITEVVKKHKEERKEKLNG